MLSNGNGKRGFEENRKMYSKIEWKGNGGRTKDRYRNTKGSSANIKQLDALFLTYLISYKSAIFEPFHRTSNMSGTLHPIA